jgi:hypothetical protein
VLEEVSYSYKRETAKKFVLIINAPYLERSIRSRPVDAFWRSVQLDTLLTYSYYFVSY